MKTNYFTQNRVSTRFQPTAIMKGVPAQKIPVMIHSTPEELIVIKRVGKILNTVRQTTLTS